jgi:imidazolonepropionase
MKLLITNIHQLINVRKENVLLRGAALAVLPILENAYLVIENGLIAEFGWMKQLPIKYFDSDITKYDEKGI